MWKANPLYKFSIHISVSVYCCAQLGRNNEFEVLLKSEGKDPPLNLAGAPYTPTNLDGKYEKVS